MTNNLIWNRQKASNIKFKYSKSKSDDDQSESEEEEEYDEEVSGDYDDEQEPSMDYKNYGNVKKINPKPIPILRNSSTQKSTSKARTQNKTSTPSKITEEV